jgi:hypothetical protein
VGKKPTSPEAGLKQYRKTIEPVGKGEEEPGGGGQDRKFNIELLTSPPNKLTYKRT